PLRPRARQPRPQGVRRALDPGTTPPPLRVQRRLPQGVRRPRLRPDRTEPRREPRRDRRADRPPLVPRRAVPPGVQVETDAGSPPLPSLHRRGSRPPRAGWRPMTELFGRHYQTGDRVLVELDGRTITRVDPTPAPQEVLAEDDWLAPAFWDI